MTQGETEGAKRELDELKELINRNSFVLVLIDADADGYIFKDKYYADIDGGLRAALDLRTAVQKYMKKAQPELAGLPIVVKAFANYDGLSQLLVRMKLFKSLLWLNNSAKSFSQAFDTCDFVVVGAGKDRADEKIKGVFKQFITNPTCRHVIFGACHDNGYVRLLEKYQQGAVVDKVTLLYPFEPFGKPPASTTGAGTGGAQSPAEASWAARVQSKPTSDNQLKAQANEVALQVYREMAGYGISLNEGSHRVDLPLPGLYPHLVEMWNRNTKNGKIRYCYRHHLLPEGCKEGRCTFTHGSMVVGELIVFMHEARQEFCRAKGKCQDQYCYYGHHCSCSMKDSKCKFPPTMHNVDLEIASLEPFA
ncbi:hypothetical protein BDW74DRAFT_181236 [Aspergillus multicolor]|uniref:uncharacterized protein n=1 Tax=Aspergillus multicolor TaxID=41759 RepID=UPI003CCE496D